MAVVSIGDRLRARATEATEHLRCTCGSTWFDLVRRPTAPGKSVAGSVVFDQTGRVVSFSGTPVCTECGRVLNFHEAPPSP